MFNIIREMKINTTQRDFPEVQWLSSFIAGTAGLILGQGTKRRRQWHPTPVLLPLENHGRRNLVG